MFILSTHFIFSVDHYVLSTCVGCLSTLLINGRKAHLLKWRTRMKPFFVLLQKLRLIFLISCLYKNVVRKTISTAEPFKINFEFDTSLLNKIINSEWVRHQILCQYCCNEYALQTQILHVNSNKIHWTQIIKF